VKPPLRPEDALELELQGKATGACPEELVQLGSTLRAAAAQIEAPIGLRARRGSIIAAPTAPVTTGRRLRFPRRRLQALLLAAALTAMSALSVAGAVGSGWIGEAVDDFVRGVLHGAPAVPGPLAPSPSPTPTRTPLPSPWQPPLGTEDAPADPADAEEDDPWTGVPGGSSVEPTNEPRTDWPSASDRPLASPSATPSPTPSPSPSAAPEPSRSPSAPGG